VSAPLVVAPEVAEALGAGRPVVALETTLVAHGFPSPVGGEVARDSERRVASAGAVPATVGIVDGAVRVGLSATELDRFAESPDARKVGPRDLAACCVQGTLGATTVGGTLAVCALAGIRAFATGGLGGVHRGYAERPDVSADLAELARAPVCVVCSGVKSLLDVPATVEILETLGVPLLGWRTDELPLFYAPRGGPPLSVRVEDPGEAAAVARTHWDLGRRGAVVVARPHLEGLDARATEELVETALRAAQELGISGQAVTPFVLARLHEQSGGRTLAVNRDLVVENAGLAAEIAVELARLGPTP
jgi:pseudouridine-5'-phosphate glycosidase